MTTTSSIATSTSEMGEWMFLGVRIKELDVRAGGLVVMEATLPEGASPPLHKHCDLDDSFYVLEGTMVIRCGDDMGLAVAGSWVPSPRGVPHTFRVLDGPARVLQVHTNRSFIDAVHAIGRPAREGDIPTTTGGPGEEELNLALAAHDISTVGPSMEEAEARSWLAQHDGSVMAPASR